MAIKYQLFARSSALLICLAMSPAAWGQSPVGNDAHYEVTQTHEQIEIIQNTSRRLRFKYNIPEFVLENPQVVQAQPVAPNELVLRGLKPGFTSITVSDPDRNLTTIDIHVLGDVRKLEAALNHAFPESTIKPLATQTGVLLQGTVARATDISPIMEMTRNYFPDGVVNQLQVGGSQMIAMQVKVYQVSRTKLRRLGIDWSVAGKNFNFVSSVSEIIQGGASSGTVSANGQNLTFGVFSSDSSLNTFLQALERNDIAKLLDEPTLVAMNGRAAEFLNGGEIPIQVSAGLGTTSVEFRPFGTKLDLVPIVLGQGRLRLEIRAEVSEVAPDLSSGTNVPGFRVRRVNTGAEMNAGYTLALAGDYREVIDSTKQGLPWLVNRPYIGQLFRKHQETKNEIELVFLITPTFISEVEQSQMPVNLPGRNTQSPSDTEFYLRGYDEVPQCKTECPLPVPMGALNAPGNVLPMQPYVPGSIPDNGPPQGPMVTPRPNPPDASVEEKSSSSNFFKPKWLWSTNSGDTDESAAKFGFPRR